MYHICPPECQIQLRDGKCVDDHDVFSVRPLPQAGLELANAIRAGVTDTPALRRIPEGINLLERASTGNPSGRATRPEDVAQAIAALTDERLYWMTGNIIGVDGGEDLSM